MEKALNKVSGFLKKNYATIVLVLLMSLALYVRMVGFHFPYLRNIDSYVFYRYMNYTVETGHVPTYDPLMLAPHGKNLTAWNMFYVLLGAKTYQIYNYFHPLPLWRYLVYFPAILAVLSAIPVYIIGKEIYDRETGLIAAFLILFSPVIMSRTLGGDPDSDSIVLLMSLLTASSVVLALKRKKWWYGVVAGISFSLFAWTWVGFWYVYWLYLGTALLMWFLEKDFSYIRDLVIATVVFLALDVIFMHQFLLSYVMSAPIKTIGLFGTGGIKAEEGQFPNVYVSVAEMQSNSISSLLRQIGGYLLIPSLFGLLYLAYSFIKRREHREAFVFLGLWTLGFAYASLTAVRFSIFLIIPLSFLAAVLFSKALRVANGEDLSR